MNRLAVFLVVLLCSIAAYAGTRFVQNTGSLPTSNTDGVPLAGMSFCRGSVRNSDGGTLMGGTLLPYYKDSILPWGESASASKCTLDTSAQADGGPRYVQVCDWSVAAPFGRLALVGQSLVDNASSPVTAPTVRLECWSAGASNVPDGGTP